MPTVALAVTGSIAAYKAAVLARLLVKAGVRVIPVMTASAAKFLGAATLSGITGNAVRADMWDPGFSGEMHVALADECDAIVIAPATADLLARLAQGRADDLVTALALCAKCPVLAAPAMHPRMWSHPATRVNVAALRQMGRVSLVGPESGEVASGDHGEGRMSEPETIAQAVLSALTEKDLAGRHVVVSAGPTLEDMDPVRFLGNRSTGKMGFSVASRAAMRGARVTLVAGPVSLATPLGVTRVDVRSAVEMQRALDAALEDAADALVMAAAVSDYRFAATSKEKTKKKKGETASLELVKNPDILAAIGASRKKGRTPLLVGFALETLGGTKLVAEARRKLATKRVDLVVANQASDSFGKETNRVHLVTAKTHLALPEGHKGDVADAILDVVRDALG